MKFATLIFANILFNLFLLIYDQSVFGQKTDDTSRVNAILRFKNILEGDWTQQSSIPESIYKINDSFPVDTNRINNLPFSPIDTRIVFTKSGLFGTNGSLNSGKYEIIDVHQVTDETHTNSEWIFYLNLNNEKYYAKIKDEHTIYIGKKLGSWGVTMKLTK